MNTDVIEARLRRRRTLARAEARQKREVLYAAYPALLKIEDEKRLVASDARLSRDERARLVKEKEDEIKAFLDANHLVLPEPEYFCPLCCDTGYVTENGRSVRCSCFNTLLLENNFDENAADPSQTFQSFDESVFDESDRAAMQKLGSFCRSYCETFPNEDCRNLILTGDTGCGKTFLLNCIFAELTKRGFGVVYLTAGRLFEILRAYAFQQDDKLSLLLDAQALLIDDFGTEPLFNNITLEYMFLLINERTRRGRAICLSTNLTPDEIKARYTERIASRLFDRRQSKVFRLPGRDLRLKK